MTLIFFITQVLHKMENVLLERCSNSCRRPSHSIKKLFHEDQGEAYEPFGENGPKVDLMSSISLVNRYFSFIKYV